MTIVRRRFETSDLDEAVEVFTAAFTGGGLQLSDFAAFRYEQDYVGAPGLAVVQQAMRAEVVSRSDESDTLFVAWTDRGNTTYRMGRQELSADAGLLWSGRRPVEVAVHAATVGSITIDRAEFEHRARRLLNADGFVLPDFVALPSPDHINAIRRHALALRHAHLDAHVVDNPLVWQLTTDLTVARVLAAAGLDVPAGTTAHTTANVRRALTYIDDNLAAPITLSDIAAAAGLSGRGLQAAFIRTLGESPMTRLKRARLARAHADLIAAGPDSTTVARIASRWGFSHLGRFARVYRAEFDELPGETLRR